MTPTIDQRNAAFDAVKAAILTLVPSFLDGDITTDAVLTVSNAGLDAAFALPFATPTPPPAQPQEPTT